jgi:peptide/nickel transport system substrate-binding protein
VARLQSPRTLSFDTFDTARAGDLSTLEVFGRTHSRLLEYEDFDAPALRGDLAAEWEQPDATTLTLSLAPGAAWHDGGTLNGRAVTAADVAATALRAIESAAAGNLPAVQRAHDWLTVESAAATDARTVTLRLRQPDPFLLNTLAGAFAFVQAPEVVETLGTEDGRLDPANLLGSGPFAFEAYDDNGALLEARDSGHRRARLERLHIASPVESVDVFRDRVAHEVTISDGRESEALASDPGPAAERWTRVSETAVISTMAVGAPPWNDVRLRQALALALDPRVLVQRLLGGRGAGCWPKVLGAGQLAAIGEREMPEPGPGETAAEAPALWSVAGGPDLGTVTIDFPNVFDPRFSASSTVTGLLNEALGVAQFQPAVETYTTIAEKLAAGLYGNGNAAFWFGWGPPMLDPVPSRVLFETYSSRGPNLAVTGFSSGVVDGLLDGLMTGLDGRERASKLGAAVAAIGAEAGGGVMPWVVQTLDVYRWRFLRRTRPTMWWDQHRDDEATVDTEDGLYRP